MKNPTGSSLERGRECAASFALPQAPNTGEAAVRGVLNHDAIEQALAKGDLTDQPQVVQDALLNAETVETEIAFALDVAKETVRVIGRRIGRDYGPLNENEIALTIDAVVAGGGKMTVWDWKSRKRVTSAARNLQLRAGCVAVMLWLGRDSVGGAIGYLDNSESDVVTVDAFDVPVFFADTRAMLKRIGAARAVVEAGGTPDVHSGSHCDYCPAMAYCPAQTRLAKTMLPELSEVERKIAFMTAEQAGNAWVLLKQIQTLADKVEASLKLRAKQEVVPLPGGKRLALVESSRTSPSAKDAIERLKQHGLPTEDLYKTTYFDVIREVKVKETA